MIGKNIERSYKTIEIYFKEFLTAFWTASFVTLGDDFLEA